MQSLLSRGFDPRPAQRDIRFTWNLISFIAIYQKLLTLQFYQKLTTPAYNTNTFLTSILFVSTLWLLRVINI